jgi:mRNA-degrading endonuclease RelE of RelBE toxin-antitoxin system
VYFTKRCEKRFRRLDDFTRKRIAKTIDEVKAKPNIGYPLEGPVLKGLFSVHSGDYRVVYRLSNSQRQIEIWAVEHRNRVYEELARYVKSGGIVARASSVSL